MISAFVLGLLAATSPGIDVPPRRTADDAAEIEAVIAGAAQAHEHLMHGDIDAYRRAIQLAPDFILMDPFGGVPTGTPGSEAHWQRIGRMFRGGRDADFRTLRAYRSGDLMVLVAIERAHVAVGALPPQDWGLRVTLVFRRDAGSWQLLHRHADPLAQGISLQQAGRMTLERAADEPGR